MRFMSRQSMTLVLEVPAPDLCSDSEILEDIFEDEKAGHKHNMTQLCHNVGVSQACQQLCSFELDSDLLTNLTSQCSDEMDKILR